MDKRKVPKSARLLKLVEIFERGHVLDKKEIDTRMTSALGEERKALYLALYRDLQDLVAQGVLAQKFFRADGGEIDAGEVDSEKYYVSKWCLADADHAVIGKGILVQSGGNLFLGERLRNKVSVRELGQVDLKSVNIVFDLSRAARIVIGREDLPFKLLICRSSPQMKKPLIQSLEEKFGKRLVILTFLDQLLSSVKNVERPGHILLDISESALNATDLGTRNPSAIGADIGAAEFWATYTKPSPSRDDNQTLDQRRMELSGLSFEQIPASGIRRSLPSVIRLSDLKTIVVG